VALPDNPEVLREALDKLKSEPEWQLLWEHLLVARQGCLLRLAHADNWEQCLEIRGELNALNEFLEFGDSLLTKLEELQLEVQRDDKRAGRGREGGYTGRGET